MPSALKVLKSALRGVRPKRVVYKTAKKPAKPRPPGTWNGKDQRRKPPRYAKAGFEGRLYEKQGRYETERRPNKTIYVTKSTGYPDSGFGKERQYKSVYLGKERRKNLRNKGWPGIKIRK